MEGTHEFRSVLTRHDGTEDRSGWTTEHQARQTFDIDRSWLAEQDPDWTAKYRAARLERRFVGVPETVS